MKHSSLPASLLLIIIAALLGSCSRSDSFSVKGAVTGLPDGTVTMTYYTGDAVLTASAEAVSGRFELKAESPEYCLAELRSGGTSLGAFIARGGDKIKVDGTYPDSIRFSGSKPVRMVTEWEEAHPGSRYADADSVNRWVAEQIAAEGVTPAGAFLLLTRYNAIGREEQTAALLAPFLADESLGSLLEQFNELSTRRAEGSMKEKVFIISQKAWGDSTFTYTPAHHKASILAFTREGRGGDHRRRLADMKALCASLDTIKGKPFRLVELSLLADSLAWTSAVKADSAVTWTRTFIPGGPGSPAFRRFAISAAPTFVVVDSAGAQRYRGQSLDVAADTVRALLKAK